MNIIKRFITFAIILFIVQGLWMGLELCFYGEIQPRIVDNVVGLILAISLFYNLKAWLILSTLRSRRKRTNADCNKKISGFAPAKER